MRKPLPMMDARGVTVAVHVEECAQGLRLSPAVISSETSKAVTKIGNVVLSCSVDYAQLDTRPMEICNGKLQCKIPCGKGVTRTP